MKKLLTLLGRMAFWASWPVLYIYMRGSRRTRVLVVCADEILVVKHWLGRDFWQLPGGGLHKKEDVVVGAARELREETGITVSTTDLRHLGSQQTTVVNIPLIHEYVLLQVGAKPTVTMQKLEIRNYTWLHVEDRAVLASRSLVSALAYLKQQK